MRTKSWAGSLSLEDKIHGHLFADGDGGDGGGAGAAGGGAAGSGAAGGGAGADGAAGGGAGDSGAGGAGAGSEGSQVDWREALAGGDSARLEKLKAYETPEQLITRLDTNWRKDMAGDDPEALKFLEKYNDPAAAYKAWRSATAKISEGGKVKIPGENATPEELAEWAKAMGVAEAPDKYEITAKPDDKIAGEIGDGDKAMLGEITNRVHEAFKAGKVDAGTIVNLAHQVYYDMTLKASEMSLERGLQLAQEAEAENRKIWGDADYQKMIEYAIGGAKQFFPGQEDEFYKFMGQRLETGHALFDHPIVQRMFAQIGLQTIEDPMFLALQDGKTTFDIEKRIDEIRGMRNGSQAQRAEYARLSAPGGELARLLESKARKGRAA